MPFTPADHPYVGTRRAYIPSGFSPYAPEPIGPDTVGSNGNTVTVHSAWTRDYLPNGGVTLLYVQFMATGRFTHVTAADLPLTAD